MNVTITNTSPKETKLIIRTGQQSKTFNLNNSDLRKLKIAIDNYFLNGHINEQST